MSKAQNNTSEALRYHEIYTGLRDSLFNEENVRRLAHLELKNELEKEKAELTDANNFKLRRQRIILLATVLTLFLVIIFATITWRFYQQKRNANENRT